VIDLDIKAIENNEEEEEEEDNNGGINEKQD